MKNKIIFSAFLTLAFLVVLTSCKPKEDDPIVPNTKTCRLASYVRNSSEITILEYTADGKLSKMTYPADSVYFTFEYKGDSIIEYASSYRKIPPFSTTVAQKFKLNGDGNIVWGENSFSYSTYMYDNNGYLQTYSEYATGSSITNTYTVTNGNYASYTSISTNDIPSTRTYSYDMTKEDKESNMHYELFGIANLRYGKKNKNVLKGYTNIQGSHIEQASYAYEYDSDGNITKETETRIYDSVATNTNIMLYTFKCE